MKVTKKTIIEYDDYDEFVMDLTNRTPLVLTAYMLRSDGGVYAEYKDTEIDINPTTTPF